MKLTFFPRVQQPCKKFLQIGVFASLYSCKYGQFN